MFILCDMLTSDTYQLYCPDCKKPTDIVDADCVKWMIERREPGLCCDCSGLQADKVHEAIDNEKNGVVTIKRPFDWRSEAIFWNDAANFWRKSYTHSVERYEELYERVRTCTRCTCLSSSTNLNRNQENEVPR